MSIDYTADTLTILTALGADCSDGLAVRLVRTFLEKAHAKGKIEAVGELSVRLSAAKAAPATEAAHVP